MYSKAQESSLASFFSSFFFAEGQMFSEIKLPLDTVSTPLFDIFLISDQMILSLTLKVLEIIMVCN